MSDWTFDLGEFRISAESTVRGVGVTLDLETESLDVDCEQGYGYGLEHICFSIPLDVLKRLLAAREALVSLAVKGEP